MFTKQKFTTNLCLQNKSLQTRYAYKTKVYKRVMFTKPKLTDKLCLQNETRYTVYRQAKFTNITQNKTESLQKNYD